MKPFLIVCVPLFLMLVQIETRLGYRPLLPNESALVRTSWRPTVSVDKAPCPTLVPDKGLRLESPPVRIGEENEVDWRIRATRMGTTGLVLKTMNDSIALRVFVSERLIPISPRNVPKDTMDVLWYPAGQALPPDGDLLSVEIGYPRRDFLLFGATVHWIWPFLFVSLLAGYLLKGIFRVRF
jgi:hypothetical protein